MARYIVQTQNGSHITIRADYMNVEGASVTFHKANGRRIAFLHAPQSVAEAGDAC